MPDEQTKNPILGKSPTQPTEPTVPRTDTGEAKESMLGKPPAEIVPNRAAESGPANASVTPVKDPSMITEGHTKITADGDPPTPAELDMEKLRGGAGGIQNAEIAMTQPRTDLDRFLNPAILGSQPAPGDDTVQYTSHPIANFRVGRKWRFEKGLLKLKPDEAREFERDLAELPPTEQNRVRKLDLGAAERISRDFLAKQPHSTQQVDSTTGDRPIKPLQGKTDLADAPDGGAVR